MGGTGDSVTSGSPDITDAHLRDGIATVLKQPAWPSAHTRYPAVSLAPHAGNRRRGSRGNALQVFISWSGKQSNHVAVALRKFLPLVLDNKITPFVSSEDIEKGDRGLNKIATLLEKSAYGIVVVTPSNQNSPWINFEAGALGKSVSAGRVAPLLVGLADPDVTGPIKQFQNLEASEEKAVLSLVGALNEALDESLSEATVNVLFEKHWPQLKEDIAKAPADTTTPKQDRSETDLLNEVLKTVRSLKRTVDQMQAGLGNPREGRAGSLEREISDLIAEALSITSIGCASKDDEVTVRLPQGAGAVDGTLLGRIQKFAVDNLVHIKVERPNGNFVAYAPDGTETRLPPLPLEPLKN